MPNPTVTANSATPASQSQYDPIQMLRDYLKDNPNAPSYLSNYLVNRMGDQLVWYDKNSAKHKRQWMVFRRTIIILSACIPFLVGMMDMNLFEQWVGGINFILKLVIGTAGVAIAILEGLNSLYKSQEFYIEYRITAEQLKQEFAYFLGKSGEYEGLDDAAANAKLVSRAESIMANQNNRWAEVARQNEKAIKADDIQAYVQDYLEKRGVVAPKAPEQPGAEG